MTEKTEAARQVDLARAAELERTYDAEMRFRTLSGFAARLVPALLVALSVFHYYTAGFGILTEHWHKAIHLSAVLGLIFLMFPAGPRIPGPAFGGVPWYDWLLAAVMVSACLYLPLVFDDLTFRIGSPNTNDVIMGTLMLVLTLETARRSMGWALPIIVLICVAYGLWGNYLSGVLAHPGADWAGFISHIYLTQEGIFGIPVMVVATYVFHFVLFGVLATRMGLGQFFIDMASIAAGRFAGGPAKVSVFGSALFGMISADDPRYEARWLSPAIRRRCGSRRQRGRADHTAHHGGCGLCDDRIPEYSADHAADCRCRACLHAFLGRLCAGAF